MKNNMIWTVLLVIGILPFILPFIFGFYRMSIESWKLADWLIMYSFIYWPTYLIGLAMIAISVHKLRK